jgi:hypothetical protein
MNFYSAEAFQTHETPQARRDRKQRLAGYTYVAPVLYFPYDDSLVTYRPWIKAPHKALQPINFWEALRSCVRSCVRGFRLGGPL